MKRFLCLFSFLLALSLAKADEYSEFYNYVSDDIRSFIEDLPINRIINGGTVIIPEFDESCPEEMKAPFIYACKLVEEYIPPCLPIRAKVRVGNINGSQRNAISKVTNVVQPEFGSSGFYDNATMSTIKGVILGEMCYDVDVTYLRYVPNIQFLNEEPDIEIIYNKSKLDEIYFSLDTNPGDKYDFVSLALRDLIRGFGFYHNYIFNPVNNEIRNPQTNMLPFEVEIDKALGKNSTAEARLSKATQGELPIYQQLKLYAPETWVNGTSLNYFIPNDQYKISKILSYDFCKGMVCRSLNENSIYLFNDLLGWRCSYPVGIGTPNTSGGGSTDLKMDYNGTFYIGDVEPEYGYNMQIASTNVKLMSSEPGDDDSKLREDHWKAVDYVYQFYPYFNPAHDIPTSPGDGFTVAILKKDGTWDIVFALQIYVPGMPYELQMSELEFHCDPDEYERTVEGYLRARIATNFTSNWGYKELRSTYFVIDYLPPKVKLRYDYINGDVVSKSPLTASPNAASYDVRLYLADIEGVDHIILECLRQGSRFPNKLRISDVKKGYFDVTIDKPTTFTAVAYNDNGQTRGIPVLVDIPTGGSVSTLNFQMQDDTITVNATEGETGEFDFSIMPLTASASQFSIGGNSGGEIDISSLPQGLYVLNVTDYKTGLNGTFKFKK
ncbi:MAG: hypothetical protein HDS52_02010 [Barnesiella sp.]|nr:hypothetical protein [Barnesiella sp.]